MALHKSIISTRTGAALSYHEVLELSFRNGRADVVVASYPDKAAKDAGHSFSEASPENFPYDGSTIAKSAQAFAEDHLLALDKYAGADKV